MSKAASLQLTRNLAVAPAPEVRVNAAVPLRRTAGTDHVAQVVLGLLTMDLVTGETVILDGGKHVTY